MPREWSQLKFVESSFIIPNSTRHALTEWCLQNTHTITSRHPCLSISCTGPGVTQWNTLSLIWEAYWIPRRRLERGSWTQKRDPCRELKSHEIKGTRTVRGPYSEKGLGTYALPASIPTMPTRHREGLLEPAPRRRMPESKGICKDNAVRLGPSLVRALWQSGGWSDASSWKVISKFNWLRSKWQVRKLKCNIGSFFLPSTTIWELNNGWYCKLRVWHTEETAIFQMTILKIALTCEH